MISNITIGPTEQYYCDTYVSGAPKDCSYIGMGSNDERHTTDYIVMQYNGF